MTALRVVLVGAGARSRKLYLPWLAGDPVYRIVPAQPLAVLDSNLEAAQEAATGLPDVVVAGPQDFEQVLTDTRPDLVVVATPDFSHHGYALSALGAGCPVLVEKPLATTIEDAFDLVRAAEASQARLIVGHNLRFTNIHTRIRQLLVAGRIGTMVRADFHYRLNTSHAHSYFTRWHRSRAASGGLEVTKAAHHLDLLAWWLDARPIAVTAVLKHEHYRPGAPNIPLDSDIHDSIRAEISYNSGAVVHYTLTVNTLQEGYTCTLHGTKGTCTISYNARHGPHILRLNTHNGLGTQRIPREAGTHAGADLRMLRALPHALMSNAKPACATAAESALSVATGVTMHTASIRGQKLPIPQLISAHPKDRK